MKFLLTAFLILFIPVSHGEQTYLLLDAVKIPQPAKQPTWIALRGFEPFRFIHVPVGESIVAIEPGKYRVHHFDEQNSVHSGIGTRHVRETERLSFEVQPNVINFVGVIQIERLGTRRIKAQIVPSDKLLAWACEKKPKVFETLPVSMPVGDGVTKMVKINCETRH